MIDRELSPMTFSVAKFLSATAALFVKLPLETVLRRGQVAVLASPQYINAAAAASRNSSPGASARGRGRRLGSGVLDSEATLALGGGPVSAESYGLETIVPTGAFDGVFGTMRNIVVSEGSRPVPTLASAKTARPKKGKARIVETVYRRGQGMEGLWRGWRVSWWGLVGLWTAGVMGGAGDGEF
jgi:fusion and transport protein UGO1